MTCNELGEATIIMQGCFSIIKPDITLIHISRECLMIKEGITWEAANDAVTLLLVRLRVRPGTTNYAYMGDHYTELLTWE